MNSYRKLDARHAALLSLLDSAQIEDGVREVIARKLSGPPGAESAGAVAFRDAPELRKYAEFLETTLAWYGELRQWSTRALPKFIKAGDKIWRLLGIDG